VKADRWRIGEDCGWLGTGARDEID